MRAAATIFALATALVGCAGDLPPESRVDKLRLLAVRAEPPEVAVGMPSLLDTLTVGPPPLGAPAVSYLWMACIEAPGASSPTACGVSVGGNGGPGTFGAGAAPLPDCAASPSAALCTIGTAPSLHYTPGSAAAGGQVILTVIVADDAAGGASQCAADAANNGGAPTNADHCIVALKRLTVGVDAQPNHNPAIDALLFDGAAATPSAIVALPAAGGAKTVQLDARRAAGSAEVKSDGTVEELLVAWYDTAGALAESRTAYRPADCDATCMKSDPPLDSTSSWNPPSAGDAARQAPDGTVDFWVVLRDDRGGIAWSSARGKLAQ